MHGEVPSGLGWCSNSGLYVDDGNYMVDAYSPDNVASTVGISAARIRQFAADLANAAFAKEVVINQPWTDWKGEKHETMVGRPVSMHSMRGISAHSNGFQTCRALHVLQLMLGSIEVPGGWRFKPHIQSHRRYTQSRRESQIKSKPASHLQERH